MHKRRPDVPRAINDIAWKAQGLLRARYSVAIIAIARELVGFLWDVARKTESETMSSACLSSYPIISDRDGQSVGSGEGILGQVF